MRTNKMAVLEFLLKKRKINKSSLNIRGLGLGQWPIFNLFRKFLVANNIVKKSFQAKVTNLLNLILKNILIL